MNQTSLGFEQELVVDLFAGGGGASSGITAAYREPDVAVNHDPVAIAVHKANHPGTTHYTCDVFEVDPRLATAGRPVGLLWASPDCRHHSKAKGGKPRSKRVRALAWVVVKWAEACSPRVIILENVEEFADWGPLLSNGQPCPLRKGFTFRRWCRELEKLGYKVEHRELRACDYGAPTIRKRLYVVARRDGLPVVWPAATHAKVPTRGLLPYRTAAECIDWSVPCPSIITRKRCLKPNSLRRVAKGICRFVIDADKPFIVPFRGTSAAHVSTHDVVDPLATVTGGGTHHGLVTPVLIETAHSDESPTGVKRYGAGVKSVVPPLGTVQAGGGNFAVTTPHLMHLTHHGARPGTGMNEQIPTVTAAHRGEQALCAPVMVGVGGRAGQSAPRTVDAPHHTTTTKADTALVAAHIAKFRFDSAGSAADAPLHTITAGGAMKRDAGAAHAMGVVTAYMEQANTDMVGHDARKPVSTIVGKGCTQRLVTAHLIKYFGSGGQWQDARDPMHTSTTKARMAVVETVAIAQDTLTPEQWATARGCALLMQTYAPERFPVEPGTTPPEIVLIGDYILVDIGLRMLAPRELARAQGFDESYHLETGIGIDGAPLKINKTQQVRLIGNSVCPDVAQALVASNLSALIGLYQRTQGAAP